MSFQCNNSNFLVLKRDLIFGAICKNEINVCRQLQNNSEKGTGEVQLGRVNGYQAWWHFSPCFGSYIRTHFLLNNEWGYWGIIHYFVWPTSGRWLCQEGGWLFSAVLHLKCWALVSALSCVFLVVFVSSFLGSATAITLNFATVHIPLSSGFILPSVSHKWFTTSNMLWVESQEIKCDHIFFFSLGKISVWAPGTFQHIRQVSFRMLIWGHFCVLPHSLFIFELQD